MKSSCTGCEPFWRVNVVVVLPVPDRTDDQDGPLPGIGRDDFAPACIASPPAWNTFTFHIRSPALLRLPEVVGVEHPGHPGGEVDGDEPIVG